MDMHLFNFIFFSVCKNNLQMKGKNTRLLQQIDCFKNHEQMGLFTFYLQTIDHNGTIISKSISHHEETSKESHKTINKEAQFKKLCQYRLRNKPQRRLKTLEACGNHNKLSFLEIESNERKRKMTRSEQEFEKVKEMFNFKREKSKKVFEELLAKNGVENISQQQIKQKQMMNPEKLIVSKKYTLNEYPQHLTPFKSGYLSKIVNKKYKSLDKGQKIKNTSSQQTINPKEQSSVKQAATLNELGISFKLDQQRFRPIMLPYYKRRGSSYLKESSLSQSHLLSNDNLIQKLKKSNKIVEQKEKILQNGVLDIKNILKPYEATHQVQVSHQRKAHRLLIPNRLERSEGNKQEGLSGLGNKTEMDCFLRERLTSLRKNIDIADQQRNKNYSEIVIRNYATTLTSLQASRRNSRNNKNNKTSMQRNKKNAQVDDLKHGKCRRSQNFSSTKKNLLIIVTKVKEKYVSL